MLMPGMGGVVKTEPMFGDIPIKISPLAPGSPLVVVEGRDTSTVYSTHVEIRRITELEGRKRSDKAIEVTLDFAYKKPLRCDRDMGIYLQFELNDEGRWKLYAVPSQLKVTQKGDYVFGNGIVREHGGWTIVDKKCSWPWEPFSGWNLDIREWEGKVNKLFEHPAMKEWWKEYTRSKFPHIKHA